MKNQLLLQSSITPVATIESLPRRPEQSPLMRQYQAGYEDFFNILPILDAADPLLELKVEISGSIMRSLAKRLKDNYPWTPHPIWNDPMPGAKEFHRVIIAVAEPQYEEIDEAVHSLMVSPGGRVLWAGNRKLIAEGPELLVAKWGEGFSSPVHGHAAGLLHEEILMGRIRVNTYRHANMDYVRPVRTDIVGPGTLVSAYSPPHPVGKRMGLVHNFEAIVPSVSLHYVAEHTRDGRDNMFQVEHFHTEHPLSRADVTQITGEEGRRLQVGDVALVRSKNVPDYGDHYIVITGAPELKPHGLRPADVAIAAPDTAQFLDWHPPLQMGLSLLKLSKDAAATFLWFHGIHVQGKTVTFPVV